MLHKLALCLLVFTCTACSQQSAPESHAEPSFGLLDLKLGEVYTTSSDSRTPGAVAGIIMYDLPIPGGPLSETFYDYSAQVDANSKRLIAVLAKRTFSSYPECKSHLDRMIIAAKGKFAFEPLPDTVGYSFDAKAGPIRAQFMCSVKADLINPTLTVSLFHMALAEESQKRILRQYSGR